MTFIQPAPYADLRSKEKSACTMPRRPPSMAPPALKNQSDSKAGEQGYNGRKDAVERRVPEGKSGEQRGETNQINRNRLFSPADDFSVPHHIEFDRIGAGTQARGDRDLCQKGFLSFGCALIGDVSKHLPVQSFLLFQFEKFLESVFVPIAVGFYLDGSLETRELQDPDRSPSIGFEVVEINGRGDH